MDGTEMPRSPHNPAIVGYAFVRHIGLILDELSSQGLVLWQDERASWRWRWSGTDIRAERGFWRWARRLWMRWWRATRPFLMAVASMISSSPLSSC